MADGQLPRAPRGTKAGGRRLWSSIVSEGTGFELDEHELAVLRETVRTVDQLDALAEIVAREGLVVDGGKAGPKAHPALVESRQLRLVLARLIASLRLPDEDASGNREQRRAGARGVYQLRPRASA